MPGQDSMKRMKSEVGKIIAENELEAFAKYWDLAEELLEGLPVIAFYIVDDDSYANLAILTDQSIIDIEADDDDKNLGYITVTAIKSIGKVYFRAGPIQTIPNSEEAQLTIVLSMIGATDTGPYWIAETDAEYEQLTRFGKALMLAINGQ